MRDGAEHAMMPSPVNLSTNLEALDAVGEDLKEALHDLRPRFRIHPLGNLHRAPDVDEEHRHLLALALERRLRPQDLLRKVLRGVGARVTLGRSC
jgi:hypothetical protein